MVPWVLVAEMWTSYHLLVVVVAELPLKKLLSNFTRRTGAALLESNVLNLELQQSVHFELPNFIEYAIIGIVRLPPNAGLYPPPKARTAHRKFSL